MTMLQELFAAAMTTAVLTTSGGARQSPHSDPPVLRPIPSHHVPEPLTYDLGYIAPGGERTIEVPITNPLDAWVWIRKVTPECPCMQVLDAQTEFKPFESGGIRIKFIAPDKPVHYSKRVHLVTSHPEFEHIPITITARVGVPLWVERSTIDLGTLILGEQPEVQVPIMNDGEETVRLAYAVSDNRSVIARLLKRVIEPGERQAITLSLTEAASTAGRREARITIHTNCAAQRTVQLNLRWSVDDRFRLLTPIIEIEPDRSSPQTAVVTIETMRGIGSPAIRTIELANLVGLTGTARPLTSGGRTTLTCRLDVTAGAATVGGMLIVELAEHGPPIHIPIRPVAQDPQRHAATGH